MIIKEKPSSTSILCTPTWWMRLGDLGSVALEFAALVGFFAIATLTMVDISFALSDRMRMSNMISSVTTMVRVERLNSGEIVSVLETMFAAGDPEIASYTATSSQYCRCAEVPINSCSAVCPDGVSAPSHYIGITISHTHDGFFIATLPVQTNAELQTR